MSIFDRAVAAVFPEWAAQRALARIQHSVLSAVESDVSETRWRGASKALRSMRSWIPRLGSPLTDLPPSELQTLTARSRDAYKNHLIARAAINRPKAAVVGSGIMCRPSVDRELLGLSEEDARSLNNKIQSWWTMWAEQPCECDAENTLDFYALQSLVFSSALISGDCFASTPSEQRAGGLFDLKIQVIESDRVCNPSGAADTESLVSGIERGRLGAPLAYHIARHHPAGASNQKKSWDRVPVFGAKTGRRRVMHVWSDKERAGQVRGAPFLSPILEPLQKLEQYGRAELTAAVVSALFTVFVKRDPVSGAGGDALAPVGEADTGAGVSNEIAGLGSGAIVDLEPGEDIVMANPARPNANFDPFFTAVVKQIGAALDIPTDELLLQYNASYSAARAAMLQAWRMYLQRRWWLVSQFCQPVYELFIDEVVARGLIDVTDYANPVRRYAYTRAVWTGPAKGAMDELKEVQAAKERIDAGLSTETRETAALTGESWLDVIEQRAAELQVRRDAQLPTQ